MQREDPLWATEEEVTERRNAEYSEPISLLSAFIIDSMCYCFCEAYDEDGHSEPAGNRPCPPSLCENPRHNH